MSTRLGETRLAQLHALLQRTLAEIREEEARLFRQEAARVKLAAVVPTDGADLEPGSPDAIRTWARANGYRVGDTGPIGVRVRRAYAEATGVAA